MPQSPSLNLTAKDKNSYDAIVIGSGMSGGWAAKELCDQGIRTLVLERGRNVIHNQDYPTATKDPWEFEHRLQPDRKTVSENPTVSKCYAFDESATHFFVKDKEHPYVQEKPFDWIRGYQTGGKSLMWGRETQRWSDFEFDGPARDGFATDWPIRYRDLAPWYSHVEIFAGISGNRDGIENLPDGEFLPPWAFNCVEETMRDRFNNHYPDRRMIVGRAAHLTEPREIHLKQGRGKCQARNLCHRGCPYGGYFSSNSSTLPWALRTGNLTIRPDSVVHSIIYDEKKRKATGVRVVDAHSKETTEFYAKVIFLNAACLNSNLILMNSTSGRFPKGLGNDHDVLGRYIAFQNYRGMITADIDGPTDKYYYGRRPLEMLIPSFRNLRKQEKDFQRGYISFWGASRNRADGEGIGAGFKQSLAEPGGWSAYMSMQGEVIPRRENHVRLHPDLRDPWGIPQLITSVAYTANENNMLKDFLSQGAEMLSVSGCRNISPRDLNWSPGLDIHEMGGCRMGKDPEHSMLNANNQLHSCPNVFVTDGACMTSTGNQNPSLTYMALTARAADIAVRQLKTGDL